jgi:hypothetical protein
MNETVKEKDSNELLNIILMLFGALFVLQGILSILAWFSVPVPPWLGLITDPEVMAVLGQSGIATTVLGIWCFLAGLFMFQEQEFAWGQALVVLSIIFANTIGTVIGWITLAITFNIASVDTWITMLGCLMSVIFFFWLIATKSRYT